jgi:hypothetical protein
MPYIPIVTESCDDYVLGKRHKNIVPKKNMIKASRQNELLHISLCGPFKHTWLGRSKYFFTITYDFSRKMWIFFLLQKSKAFEKLKTLIGAKGSTSSHFIVIGVENSFQQHSTSFWKLKELSSNSPQQNSVTKQKN